MKYQTSHRGVAAALVALGYKYTIETDGDFQSYVFPKKAREDATKFFMGELEVNALKFYEAFPKLRAASTHYAQTLANND